MSKWRFNLRHSNNLALIGELTDATGKSLTLSHNTSGSANWDYPMSADLSPYIHPIKTCISAEMYDWRATKAMNDLGTPGQVWKWIWSGFVLPIEEDWTGDKMKIGCVGWAERLKMRLLKRDKIWPTSDDGPIFQDLLSEMNLAAYPDASAYSVPTVAGSNPATPTWMTWGGMVPNQGVGGATSYRARSSPITIKKTKNQYVLPIFDELSGYEDGADWWVDPLTRELFVYRKRCTERNVVVAFRWGPNNLSQFSRSIATDQKTNCALVTGASGTQPAMMDDTADQAENGLIESLTSWTDENNTDVLLAEAGAQIIMRVNGNITYGVTPFHYSGDIGAPPTAVPEPFIDYDPIGDEFKLTAIHKKRGSIMLQTVRSYGATITIDEENNGSIGQLQVAP